MSRLGYPRFRGQFAIVVILATVAVCAFLLATTDINTVSAFDPKWVQNHKETELWSGPDTNAVSFGRAPQWSYFQIVGPQQGSRLHVWNPLTKNYAFIDVSAVGPSGAPPTPSPTPTPEPTPTRLIPDVPPGYQDWWVANFVETTFRSAPEPEAAPIWEVPQFRRFMVVDQQRGDWLKVWSPEKDKIGYLKASDVGPSDPSIFMTLNISAPKVIREINLPGRSVGSNTVLRSLPIDHDEAEIRPLPNNTPIKVLKEVEMSDGTRWYQVDYGDYLKGSEVRVPTPPTTTFEGKWIDVELETPAIVTAYEGNNVVFSCLAIKGYAGTPTVPGIYSILRRVADETMDSETIGIPRDGPGGYLLKHVLYTQYFTNDGASFHYNYWLGTFGWPGSHGCLGLSLDDSKWLWDWATIGTPVVIR